MTDDELHKHYASISFSKEVLGDYLAADFERHLAMHVNIWRYGNEWARKGHYEKHPVSEEEIARQRDFLKRWSALLDEGDENGWLSYEPDGGLSAHTIRTETSEWVYDETEEECEARRATLTETVTFKVRPDDDVPPGTIYGLMES